MSLISPVTVSICRRAMFSCGRQLFNPAWSQEANEAAFGRDALPHGNEYVLDVYYSGVVDDHDGMIVNLTDMKPVIGAAVEPLEEAWLNEDIAEFRAHRPTAENIVEWVWKRLPPTLGTGTLSRLNLAEGSRLSVLKTSDTMKMTRKYEFAAAHRLHMPHESDERNSELYGKCNNPRGHGHNYGLEVTVAGPHDPETGAIIALGELDRIVDEEVFEHFDHKHLNEDCPEFENMIPTSENLARVIFAKLQTRIDNESRRLVRVGLHETQKNYFEVEA
jgi:6-pyruvoyltetrahydropterin/6-carboxytetrahydropterin synthase